MPWFLRMLLTIFPVILIVQIYVTAGTYRSVSKIRPVSKKQIRLLLFSLLIYLNLLPILIILAGIFGKVHQLFMFENHLTLLDFLLLFPFWWGLIVAVEILPYFLLLDMVGLISRLKLMQKLRDLTGKFAYVKIGILVFFSLYVAGRLYFDSNYVRNSRHQVNLAGLPDALSDLEIVFLGDIQVDRYSKDSKIAQIQQKVDAVNPDLILFSGDLVTSGPEFVAQGVDLMCHLSSISGKYACMGDHDYWSAPQAIVQGLKECGWHFIEDAHQVLEYRGKKILITGVTHIYSRHISPTDLENLLAQAPAADLKILLVHQPSPMLIQTAEKYGYHLLLAGHTHGGQVQFRPFGWTFTLSMFETPYFSGEYNYRDLKVIVTNGTGFTFAPVRYYAAAEITVIRLALPR